MSFDTALSGIRAASSELEIAGNNIANASTTGFKTSRAEFGDVYATSVLGAGSNQAGAGVKVQDISQRFTQGNITFTESELDMAVNGNGFFVLSNDGDRTYTRSGAFGLDADGFVTANSGARLQGYSADSAGTVQNVLGDLVIDTKIIDPRQTTGVEQTLNFDATQEVLQTSGRTFTAAGPVIGIVQPGTSNGYPVQSLDITDPDGNTLSYTSAIDATAAQTASELNSINGITATSQSTATLTNFNNVLNPMTVTINNVDMVVSTPAELETAINNLTNSTLPGVSASLDLATNSITVSSAVGDDIRVSISGDVGATLDLAGPVGGTQALAAGGAAAVVGGELTVTVENGYSIGNELPIATGLFQALGVFNDPANTVYSDITINAFDSSDPSTYNSATSTTIYDSLGIQHVMTQFFVKQPFDSSDPTTSPNQWQMFVQIDGQNVGDPVSSDPGVPTQAAFDVQFNADGTFDPTSTGVNGVLLISNWTPTSASGNSSSVPQGPQPVLQGGTLPIPEPPNSSNFQIDLTGSTQFGASFAVNSIDQDGFAAGQLSGLTVDNGGIVFARFTNGESLALGQVLLADFANQQGLQSVGESSWAETFESGGPTINEPGTASLGAIQSGALEESNVDLSEQLVQLIIAQRNFQASAKTIETADQTTQTIINLR